MDPYDVESFKIQDMIDSDIRSLRSSELEDFLSSDIPRSPDTSDLTSLTPGAPMDLPETSLDSDDGGLGWMNSSQLYNLSTDFDCMDGLVVNPQKVLSVSIAEPETVATTNCTIATSNHSIKTEPEAFRTSVLSTNSHILTVPVQVIATTTTLLSQQVDPEKGQVNLTVAVPAPSSSPHSVGQQLLTIHQVSQHHESISTESSKPKPKSKQNTKVSQHVCSENSYPKPAYSYSCLIAMALKNSKTGSLPVNEIYDFMTENFPYFKTAPTGWKNSVRHNLSLNKCFEKIEKPSKNGTQRKGYLWAMNPAKVEKMEEELQKWGSKNLAAIKKSMANPERLELIEKGELNNTESESKPTESPATEEKEENEKGESAGDPELQNAVESLTGELSNSSFCGLGETVNMDSSLPDFDLQRGIWDNLCDDRLQFLSDSPMSSSPKQLDMLGSAMVNADENSSSASSPSDLPKSFIHANYVYTYAQSSSSSSSPEPNGSFQLLHHSSVTTSSEKSTTCDA